MSKALNFKISSALKDIIGKDLITDDYIAVFELVKNSFDAYATQVDIEFENIYKNKGCKIIIKDNGKGMNNEDLQNKWLFVAYSAKLEGTEDEGLDYRDKIYKNRPFAGAKGIGRFSCDRLGKQLYLETTKKENNPKTEVLITDWEKFEADSQQQFINVSVLHKSKDKSDFDLKHGTVLEITDLRGDWDRAKLLKLKDSLAKLINPSQKNEKSDSFKIVIDVKEELENDSQQDNERYKVNGEVKNFIFETLELKTTQILSRVSQDSKTITTELRDGGSLIYRITEKNSFTLLKDINYRLFYLNQSAKLTFGRRMGISTRQYGNVFFYRNGFRLYPYGEYGEDPLKIDSRKAQGYNRYLGTREIMGRVEIVGEQPELRETTSRGDGLIKTKTYNQLEDCFWQTLKRLERYVIDVQEWGLSIEDNIDEYDEQQLKGRIGELIAELTNAKDISGIEYGDDFLDILRDSQEDSALTVVENLKRIAKESGDENLLREAKKTEKKLHRLLVAKEEAEREARVVKEELGERESENLFLKSLKSQDFDEVISFLHHVGISAGIVDNYLTGLYNKIKKGKFIDKNELVDVLKIVIFENRKVQNISRFATRANFKLYTDAIELNLDEYLQEYVGNIVKVATNDRISISFINNNPRPFIGKFRPIELNILIDNLLSNSKKAGATSFDIEIKRINNSLLISFEDNGKGIKPEKLDSIFRYGYTTKFEGTGIGLFHIKEIVDRLGGRINVESEVRKGTKFNIIL